MQTIDFLDNVNKYLADVDTCVTTLKIVKGNELRFEYEIAGIGGPGTVVCGDYHVRFKVLALVMCRLGLA